MLMLQLLLLLHTVFLLPKRVSILRETYWTVLEHERKASSFSRLGFQLWHWLGNKLDITLTDIGQTLVSQSYKIIHKMLLKLPVNNWVSWIQEYLWQACFLCMHPACNYSTQRTSSFPVHFKWSQWMDESHQGKMASFSPLQIVLRNSRNFAFKLQGKGWENSPPSRKDQIHHVFRIDLCQGKDQENNNKNC